MKKAQKMEASIEQVLAAAMGLRLESSGALAEKETRCKENLTPPPKPPARGLRWQPQKLQVQIDPGAK